MNLSQLLIEKNKEIETERRKSVHEFLSKEMDIDRLKQEIIERFSGQIERITFQCEHLVSDFRLYLKKEKRQPYTKITMNSKTILEEMLKVF